MRNVLALDYDGFQPSKRIAAGSDLAAFFAKAYPGQVSTLEEDRRWL